MPIDQYTLNYLHHLQSAVQALHERLSEAEHRIGSLQEEVDTLKKEQQQMHIGRIEYKFDQLKIETLEGTLNIGLTPKSGKDLLDDLSVGHQQIQVPQMSREEDDTELSPTEQEVKHQIESYLQSNATNDIKQFETQHNFPLNDQYRLFIIEDIHKQIPNRIKELSKALYDNPEHRALLNNQPEKAKQLIYENLHRDILKGVNQFIFNLKSGSDSK